MHIILYVEQNVVGTTKINDDNKKNTNKIIIENSRSFGISLFVTKKYIFTNIWIKQRNTY